MFFAKRNQIKALKQELSIKDRTLADRHQLLRDLETLKSENQGLKARVEELETGLKFANQTNKELQSQIANYEALRNTVIVPNEAPQ